MNKDIKVDIVSEGETILELHYMTDGKLAGQLCDGYGNGEYYLLWESENNKKHLKIDVFYLREALKEKGIEI